MSLKILTPHLQSIYAELCGVSVELNNPGGSRVIIIESIRLIHIGDSLTFKAMITDQVIKEIYKKYTKPCKDIAELGLDRYLSILKENHNISSDEMEIVVEDLEEFNPFRMFLKRSIYGILEFDRMIAFVFRSHILFFGKEDNQLRVHIRPEKPQSLFGRLFGR